MDKKVHTVNIFSWCGVSDTWEGSNKLTSVFYSISRDAEALVVACERPLLNHSVIDWVGSKREIFDRVDNVVFDNFRLTFNITSIRDHSDRCEAIALLRECFYFFEHPVFIFLKKKEDVIMCRSFLKYEKKWFSFADGAFCRFAYKSVEDDVLWCKVHPDFNLDQGEGYLDP